MKRYLIIFIVLGFLFINATPVIYASEPNTNTGISDNDKGFFSGIVDNILTGIKNFFIPDENFFKEFKDRIMKAVDKKTGGLSSAFDNVVKQFKHLNSCQCKRSPLMLKLPKNHLYDGFEGVEADVLKSGKQGFDWLRSLSTAVIIVFTVFICYRKLIALFKN